jgi:Fe-S cluster biogenesis protein NfuA/rhodanese-related sulfurtransferase/glutaredoxin
MLGLSKVARHAPMPEWTGDLPHRPMWESDRKKMHKWQVDQGIAAAEGDSDVAEAAAEESGAALRVFFKRGCPYSRATFDLLSEREVEFERVDITTDAQMVSWLKLVTGRRTTPQIFIHGDHIGGYDELRALDLDGVLTERIDAGPQPKAADGEPAANDAVPEDDHDDDEITVGELRERLEEGASLLLLDVRANREVAAGMLEGAVHIPLGSLSEHSADLDADGVWIAYCSAGKRSLTAVDMLRKAGFRSVVSLRGGIQAWLGAGGEVVAPVANKPRKRVKLPVVHPEKSPFEDLLDDFDGDGAQTLEGDALVQRVREVLDECRPLVQADGGDIELLDVQKDVVHVQLTGNCVGCPSSQATLRQGIERRLKSRIPQLKGIESPQLQ